MGIRDKFPEWDNDYLNEFWVGPEGTVECSTDRVTFFGTVSKYTPEGVMTLCLRTPFKSIEDAIAAVIERYQTLGEDN